MKASLPILPSSVVGSHAKMGWSYLARQEAEAGSMGRSCDAIWGTDIEDDVAARKSSIV